MPKREENTNPDIDVNKIMIQNFVSLQRVMTNLSLKLDDLTTQISKLLELFEISAKTIAERRNFGGHENTEVNEKISHLMEQNKTLAKGLTLLHEARPKMQMPQPMKPQMQQKPNFPNMPKKKPVETGNDDYTKSESPEKKNDLGF